MIMPHPCPHHCPPERGGLGAILLVLAVVVIGAAIARPVARAAEVVLEVVLITAASLAGLAVISGVAYVAWRVRRWQAVNRQAIPRQGHAALRGAQAVSAPQRRAIEAPRAVIPSARVSDAGREAGGQLGTISRGQTR
jgi:uncharacterized membrane protein YebE (DUF533 family)